ncbi:MAG: carboxypeptidase regulatory-like domain-containing protein [bacterium]|nr:carboxypeptidase regulatory-like domain-containing protein [bacterium]
MKQGTEKQPPQCSMFYVPCSRGQRRGYTLLETILAIAIVGTLVVGVLSVFNYALAVIAETKARTGAITLVEQQLEMVRNLPYDAIGTTGGIPAGPLPQTQTVTLNNVSYTMTIQAVYFDDPFDGTVGGAPNDLLGNDYKKVRIAAAWQGRFSAKTYVGLTIVAPKGVETNAGGGTLSILVFDAGGAGVPQADVTVVNSLVNPPVNLTVQTDASGRYLLPGAPASVNGYQVTATKAGFSTDKTCTTDPAGAGCSGAIGNPTPTKPHVTVIAGQLTDISFAIDRLSSMVVQTIRQPTPSDWVINTGGNGFDQDNPAIALCPNGNYLFVWRDARQNNNPRIYAQQYTPAKTAVWNPDLAITTSNNQNNPDVQPDSSCNIYYAWQDDRNGNQDIYFDKYDSAGVDAWTDAKKVNVAAQNADQTYPQVVVNASSTFEYIVWQDASADAGDIYAQKFDTAGDPVWGSEVKVNSDVGAATQSLPVLALDVDENLILVWHDDRDGHNDIFGQKFTKDGVRLWSPDKKLNTDNGATEQINPAFVLDASGVFYAAWEDGRNGDSDIYAQRYDANGVPQWGQDVRVNSDLGTANQGDPSIVLSGNGTLVIVWEDHRNGTNDVYLQQLDSNGTKLVPFDTRVNSSTNGEQENPEVTLNASGKIVIVWQDNSEGNFDIRAAIYDDNPQTVTPVANVPFTLRGNKRIGENPVINKYVQTHTTDGSGTLTIPNLEWDPGYTLTPIGYTLLRSEPAQPTALDPNTTLTVILNLQ